MISLWNKIDEKIGNWKWALLPIVIGVVALMLIFSTKLAIQFIKNMLGKSKEEKEADKLSGKVEVLEEQAKAIGAITDELKVEAQQKEDQTNKQISATNVVFIEAAKKIESDEKAINAAGSNVDELEKILNKE